MHITIDTNLIIDYEEKREGWRNIKALIKLNNKGKLKIHIPVIMANEKTVNEQVVSNFNLFKDYISSLGIKIKDTEYLIPLLYFGLGFFNYGLFSFKEGKELEESIHKILFPNIEYDYSDYCQKNGIDSSSPLDKKWINSKCDVLMIWCHINNSKDVFITRDKNFHKLTKKQELINLGAKEILPPKEFLKKYFQLDN